MNINVDITEVENKLADCINERGCRGFSQLSSVYVYLLSEAVKQGLISKEDKDNKLINIGL